MGRIASSLLGFPVFNQISAKKKLLVYLYILYLWIPLRAGMKKDDRMRRRSTSNASCDDENNDLDATDTCLPRLPRLALIYYYISTTTHVFIMVHSILLKTRSVPEDKLADDFITCYLPRVHLLDLMSQKYLIWAMLAWSLIHLICRSYVTVYGRKFRLDAITFLLMEEDDFNQGRLTDSVSLEQIDAVERFPESILFVRIVLVRTRQIYLKLRPNRTTEAKEQQLRLINLNFVLPFVLLSAPVIAITPIAIYQVLFKHEPIFEGCRISYFDSVYWYRTVTTLYISLLSFSEITWLSSYLPVAYSILVFDLVQYWDAIDAKLSRLKRKMESLHSWDAECELQACDRLVGIEQDCCEIRALIGDFFRNLTWTDLTISTANSSAFFVWFLANGTVTLFGLQLEGSNNIIIRLWQVVGFSAITVLSQVTLYLKRRTEPAYSTICSLMALDKGKNKTDWIEILEHYTDRRSLYGFTLPGLGVFDNLMFFEIISYMLSLIIFVEQYEIHVER